MVYFFIDCIGAVPILIPLKKLYKQKINAGPITYLDKNLKITYYNFVQTTY
jgi:hypothetical protein